MSLHPSCEVLRAGLGRVFIRVAERALPNVHLASAEAGYRDFELDILSGLFAPAKTPKETVSQLAAWFTAAMQVAEVKAKLAVQGLYPVGTCGADFGSYLRKQYEDYGRIIREANIKAE